MRLGITVRWCPTCRGVWIDRNEADALTALATPPAAPDGLPRPAATTPAPYRYDRYRNGRIQAQPSDPVPRQIAELLDF